MELDQELQIVEEAKSNIQAFERIYREYFRAIYIFVFHRIGSQAVAEDITSDVFLSAVTAIQAFDTSKRIRFRAWLYRTASNKVADYYRRNQKLVQQEIERLHLRSTENTPEENLAIDQRKVETIASLQKIKPRYQNIIVLRFFSELEISEIGEILEMRPQQVSVLLHRALQSFKKEFAKNFPESEIFT